MVDNDTAVDFGKEGVVSAEAYVQSWFEEEAALAEED